MGIVGGSATYALSGKTGVTAFNVGASYSKGPLFASVTSANKVSSFNVGLMYTVNPTLSLASSTTHSADKPFDTFAVGGLYKASVGDIKAKVDCGGTISAAIVKDVAPKVTLTASATAPASDLSSFKYGVGIVM